MIILLLPKGWPYCDALPTNFVRVMSGGLINRYRMFRIMMNSLLHYQAYLCWSIVNDFLAWLKKLLISYQVFEKRKKAKILQTLPFLSRTNDKAKIRSQPWKTEPWTGFRALMLYHWATNSLLWARSFMVSHLTRVLYIARISDEQIVMSENGTRKTTLIREIQVSSKSFCQCGCVDEE